MTTFFLVRHGVTAHTGHKLSGWMPDVHLTDDGVAQAEAAADRLARAPIKAVYASPIDRTMETARPIAARHGLEIDVRPALGEVRYGRWTGRTFKSLRRSKLWGAVQQWPSSVRFPDGETLREVQERALDELDRIRAERPRHAVCCVTHADVIRLVAAHFLGVHVDLFQRIVISPASITVVAVGNGGPQVLALNVPPRSLEAT